MRLYFLRHGIAEDRAPSGRDFDRALTAEGRARMVREAKTMAVLRLGIDRIITSPLVRAKQTATIVAASLDFGESLVVDERLGAEFGPDPLAHLLAEHPDVDTVLLVGHEPGMSRTIGHLVGGARLDVKKGALACVELAGPSLRGGELRFLLPPKVLAR
jgi:phosphohistidine phosphatase